MRIVKSRKRVQCMRWMVGRERIEAEWKKSKSHNDTRTLYYYMYTKGRKSWIFIETRATQWKSRESKALDKRRTSSIKLKLFLCKTLDLSVSLLRNRDENCLSITGRQHQTGRESKLNYQKISNTYTQFATVQHEKLCWTVPSLVVSLVGIYFSWIVSRDIHYADVDVGGVWVCDERSEILGHRCREMVKKGRRGRDTSKRTWD